MILYKTKDMESSIRRMVELNDKSIVFIYHQTDKRIRPRLDLVKDIPSTLVQPWTDYATRAIAQWDKLLYYRHHQSCWKLPSSDAMLLVETPLSVKSYRRYTQDVAKESVIYMPPDWSMHYEQLDMLYPSLKTYKQFHKALDVFRVLFKCDRHSFVQKLSGLTNSAVFSSHEFTEKTGIDPKKVRHMLYHGYRREYRRYFMYRLVSRPDNYLSEAFDILAKEPNVNGLVALRGDELSRVYEVGGIKNRVPKFKSHLKLLVKNNNVMKYDEIYVVGKRKLSYDEINANSKLFLNEFEEMRKLVTNAKEYLT